MFVNRPVSHGRVAPLISDSWQASIWRAILLGPPPCTRGVCRSYLTTGMRLPTLCQVARNDLIMPGLSGPIVPCWVYPIHSPLGTLRRAFGRAVNRDPTRCRLLRAGQLLPKGIDWFRQWS